MSLPKFLIGGNNAERRFHAGTCAQALGSFDKGLQVGVDGPDRVPISFSSSYFAALRKGTRSGSTSGLLF